MKQNILSYYELEKILKIEETVNINEDMKFNFIKTVKYIPEETVPEIKRKVTSLEDLEERVKKLEASIRKGSKKKEDTEDESWTMGNKSDKQKS